jgi:hypothetical protein
VATYDDVLSAILIENEDVPRELAVLVAELSQKDGGVEGHEAELRQAATKLGWVLTYLFVDMAYFARQLGLDDPVTKLHHSEQDLIKLFDSPKELVTIGDVREFLRDGYGILPYVESNADVVRGLYLVFVDHGLL